MFLAGGCITIALALFVWWRRRGNQTTLSTTFLLMMLAIATFQFSHVLGVMADSAELSRKILMFNLSVIFIAVFIFHWFLALIGQERENRFSLLVVYFSGILLFLYYLIDPSSYLLPSVPKLYLPYYYEPGNLQIIMRIWFNLVVLYGLYQVFRAYRKTTERVDRNRYLYVFASIFYGFVVGSTAVLLVYDIPFDPMWASFFGLFALPLAYCVVKYELMDISIAAKNAAIYGSLVIIVSLIMVLSFVIDDAMSRFYPQVPRWVTPLLPALLAVSLAGLVWRSLKVTDTLKYEFVTIISHKFRTPLTHIRLAADEVGQASTLSEDDREQLKAIKASNAQLVGLVNSLVDMSEAESGEFLYKPERIEVNGFLREIIRTYADRFKRRDISVTFTPSADVFVTADRGKLEFVLQTLIDNVLLYSGTGRPLSITVSTDKREVGIVVEDKGIGIPKNAIPNIFKKFYRTGDAKQMNTEGMGIGLYVSRIIMRRSGGSISVFSAGEGKGSTFSLKLPRVS